MTTVTIHAARTNLSKRVDQAASGTEIVRLPVTQAMENGLTLLTADSRMAHDSPLVLLIS